MSTYLVALDASPRAPAVLRTAVELGRKTGVKLQLFRTFSLPTAVPAEAYAVLPGNLEDMLRKQEEAGLARLAQEVPPELLAGQEVRLGAPWEAICDAARQHKAELIVIGAHGYRWYERVLGTTAAAVINHADRPVLVVRLPDPTKSS